VSLREFNAQRLQFAIDVLQGIMAGASVSNSQRLMKLTVEQFVGIGIGGGFA
jgi:hypothetical protein